MKSKMSNVHIMANNCSQWTIKRCNTYICNTHTSIYILEMWSKLLVNKILELKQKQIKKKFLHIYIFPSNFFQKNKFNKTVDWLFDVL